MIHKCDKVKSLTLFSFCPSFALEHMYPKCSCMITNMYNYVLNIPLAIQSNWRHIQYATHIYYTETIQISISNDNFVFMLSV